MTMPAPAAFGTKCQRDQSIGLALQGLAQRQLGIQICFDLLETQFAD
jgi:hypothetical protein